MGGSRGPDRPARPSGALGSRFHCKDRQLISNRQSSSRRRGRGGSQRSSNSQGQRDSGNRIDSRTRGNAAQLLEKYKNMARDAQMQGDRVNTEYYLQFADHYFRVLSDSRARQDDHRPVRPVDDFDGMDEEYGDEGEPIRSGEQAGYDGQRHNGQQPRSDGNRDGGRSDGNRQPRDYQQRDDRGQRDYQPREQQSRDDRQPREQQARDQQPREDRPSRDSQRREYPPRAPAAEAQQTDIAAQPQPEANGGYRNGAANDVEAPKPDKKPRSRSRSSAAAAPAPAPEMEVASMDADRLPPSLGIVGEAVAASEEEAPKPKRRRTTRTAAPAPSEAQAG